MEYIKVNFNPVQLKLIQNVAKRLCELVNVSTPAMRCIIWHALSEWQRKYNKTITEIDNMPMGKKIIAAKEIFNIGKRELKTMLNEPKEQNEILLDIIFERAFKYYLEYTNKLRM
ncbi:MAG: hypothetical protein ACXACC_05165 [Promethearchaeota archaeon]|jgi:hypothetical protein